MTTVKELAAKVALLQEALDIEQEQVQQALDALISANQTLQSIIDSGTIVDPSELQAVADQIDVITADLAATIPETTTTQPEDTTTTTTQPEETTTLPEETTTLPEETTTEPPFINGFGQ